MSSISFKPCYLTKLQISKKLKDDLNFTNELVQENKLKTCKTFPFLSLIQGNAMKNIDNNSNDEGSREDTASLDRTRYSSIALITFEESPN